MFPPARPPSKSDHELRGRPGEPGKTIGCVARCMGMPTSIFSARLLGELHAD